MRACGCGCGGGACTTCDDSGSWGTAVSAGVVFIASCASLAAWYLEPAWLFDPETGYRIREGLRRESDKLKATAQVRSLLNK